VLISLDLINCRYKVSWKCQVLNFDVIGTVGCWYMYIIKRWSKFDKIINMVVL
jgi:hypothetical protein